ncbi:TRAP transporter small permease [Bordetella genomosp. 7]|uniref:TRAP transporter small permease n=1 Tax=Bordetella genomosp. 7 TaxID=1416805 RepID=UPI001482D99A|nr:TRAP transporter small permease [Bordetella genomosp. 7]
MPAADPRAPMKAVAPPDRLGRALDRLGSGALTASACMLLLMMVLMCVEIAARLFFKTSIQISEEYSGYLFTWATMGGFLYAQRSDRFLRVDALRNALPVRVRAAVDGLAALAGAVLSLILLEATWHTFYSSVLFETTSMQYSETPLYLPQVIMPVGFALLTLAFLHTAFAQWRAACGLAPVPQPMVIAADSPKAVQE